jgi:hypothetical protein
MQNTLSALESMEYNTYDLCFVADNVSEICSMNAYEFLRVSKVIGSRTPVVLLTNDESDSEQEGLPPVGFHPTDPICVRFADVLLRPYTRSEVCMTICHAFTAPSPKGRTSAVDLPAITQIRSRSNISPIPYTPTRTDSSAGAAMLQDITFQTQSLSNLPLSSSLPANVWGVQQDPQRQSNQNMTMNLPIYPSSYIRSSDTFQANNYDNHSQCDYSYSMKRSYGEFLHPTSSFQYMMTK